jgi:hypothetical protein
VVYIFTFLKNITQKNSLTIFHPTLGVVILQSSKIIKTSALRLKLRGKVKSKDRGFCLVEEEVPITEIPHLERKYLKFPFSFNLPTDIPSSCNVIIISY